MRVDLISVRFWLQLQFKPPFHTGLKNWLADLSTKPVWKGPYLNSIFICTTHTCASTVLCRLSAWDPALVLFWLDYTYHHWTHVLWAKALRSRSLEHVIKPIWAHRRIPQRTVALHCGAQFSAAVTTHQLSEEENMNTAPEDVNQWLTAKFFPIHFQC